MSPAASSTASEPFVRGISAAMVVDLYAIVLDGWRSAAVSQISGAPRAFHHQIHTRFVPAPLHSPGQGPLTDARKKPMRVFL